MLYKKKINVELIVVADEAEEVVAELNARLDTLEERPHFLAEDRDRRVRLPGTPKRSALAHTRAAGESVAIAVRVAPEVPASLKVGASRCLFFLHREVLTGLCGS
jgi:hypothetical protein